MRPSPAISVASRPLLAGVAVIALICASACGTHRSAQEQAAARQAEVRKQIVSVIADPARTEQVLGAVDEWYRCLDAQAQGEAGFVRRLDALNADYNAPAESFASLYAERHAGERQFVERALALRDRIVAATTPAEWERLKDVRAELRDPAAATGKGAMP